MRIATYNLWNSEAGMPIRLKYIIDEIKRVDVDVLCLQEVFSKEIAEKVAHEAAYQYSFFDNYPNESEGLCILSRFPFLEWESYINNANALYVSFLCDDKKTAVINLHLPWDSVAERERCIVDIVETVEGKSFDNAYLAGDFNSTENADVQRFLMGECLLNGREAEACWYDLALTYAEITYTNAEATLNFRENPRFRGNTIERNLRADRILLRNTYPNKFPVLQNCVVFGKTIYEDIDLAASDHYGVAVDII